MFANEAAELCLGVEEQHSTVCLDIFSIPGIATAGNICLTQKENVKAK